MLYVTTRSTRDAYTANRSLCEDRGPDGGLFVPFRLNPLSEEQRRELMSQSFGQNVAFILNLFFSSKLSGWDVDFTVGRSICKLSSMNHRIMIAEVWHNQDWEFEWIVSRLSARLKGVDPECEIPSDWLRMTARIAALFGVFAQLRQTGEWDGLQPLDIAVSSSDFSAPMAAWYARYMGLNVGTIICACNENNTPWDLLNYGQMRTDFIPADLERLICAALGQEEAQRYSELSRKGRPYSPGPERTRILRNGLFAAVVGEQRMKSIIPSVSRTSNYLLDPDSAIAYGGLQDYRSKTGEVRPTLLMMEKSPAKSANVIAPTLGVTPAQLIERLQQD